jgi:hypothetical protein
MWPLAKLLSARALPNVNSTRADTVPHTTATALLPRLFRPADILAISCRWAATGLLRRRPGGPGVSRRG